jgi:hypothetical protein
MTGIDELEQSPPGLIELEQELHERDRLVQSIQAERARLRKLLEPHYVRQGLEAQLASVGGAPAQVLDIGGQKLNGQ